MTSTLWGRRHGLATGLSASCPNRPARRRTFCSQTLRIGEIDDKLNEITLRIALKRLGLGILTVRLTKYPSAGRSARTTH